MTNTSTTGRTFRRQRLVTKARNFLAAEEPASVTDRIADDCGGDRDEAAEIVAEAMRTVDGGEAAKRPRLTDVGNALRLVNRHGDKLRYLATEKRWLAWDGRRWATDDTLEAQRLAKDVVRALTREAASIADDEDRQKLTKWAYLSESAARQDAMLKLARDDTRIVIRADDLDADPWTLNVANGILDLRTLELAPHDPAAMHSKITRAAYDLQGPSDRWDSFLAEVLPDPDVRHFVQKLAGYSLTGDIGENVLPFCYGSGANGKSVFLGVLGDVLGDYADQAPPGLLERKRGDKGIPADIANLRGFRFVTTTEVEDGRAMAAETMKLITGERQLKARDLYKPYATFENVTKVWMAGNDRPQVDGLDEAVWRRVKLIPFTVTIPAEKRNPNLHAELLEEADGILSWAVEGLRAYHAEGLTPPAAVQTATDDYRAESNPLLEWADSRCELEPDAWTPSAQLREDYEAWCRPRHVKPVGRRGKWSAGLRSLGCSDEKRGPNRVRGWAGIRLRDRSEIEL